MAKYSGFTIAVVCLIAAVLSWEKNWMLSSVLLAGVLLCTLIGISTIKNKR